MLPGAELRVWYGAFYAKKMEKPVLKPPLPPPLSSGKYCDITNKNLNRLKTFFFRILVGTLYSKTLHAESVSIKILFLVILIKKKNLATFLTSYHMPLCVSIFFVRSDVMPSPPQTTTPDKSEAHVITANEEADAGDCRETESDNSGSH